MIIKSIFRRYEKWNPVHPTSGAFWGIGVGIGCGVGWGPGFGPEVIGYIGAGCGAGFSVGITFLGLGIGFPANHILRVPYSAFMVTTRGALDVARAGALLGKRGLAGDGDGDGWGETFKTENWRENMIDFGGMKSTLDSNGKKITDCFERVRRCLTPWDRGSKVR